jgi:hypothetical protein
MGRLNLMAGVTYSQLEPIVDGLITGKARGLEIYVWPVAATRDYPLRMAISILRSFHDYPYFKVDMERGLMIVGRGADSREFKVVPMATDPINIGFALLKPDQTNITLDHACGFASVRAASWLTAAEYLTNRRKVA